MAVTSRPIDHRPRGAFWRRWGQFTPLATAVAYGLLLVALALIMQRGVTWGQRQFDHVRYGYPRTVHLSSAVGAGEPTQFTALNLVGQITIFVFPGSDINRMSTLAGPYVVGEDGPYAVPRLALQDLNADNVADLLVTVRGETIVYLDRGETYGLLTAEERTQMLEQDDG